MGADRLIFIRTDGNSKIAAGHLVRCLSIAQSCLNLGMSVCFLLSDEESLHLLNSFSDEDLKQNPHLSARILKTARYDDLEKELPEVLALLSEASIPKPDTTGSATGNCVYLLDSYFVTEKYITQIGAVTKIAYIDDLQLFDYPVNLVINYDVIPEPAMPSYRSAYQKAGKALLGASYTPLRSQFEAMAAPVKETLSNILVTTGGSDPYHFCVDFIQTYAQRLQGSSVLSIPTLHVVIGNLSKDKERLYSLEKEHSFIKLYENVTDMASLMRSCDLAVSAAGTTLYELCAVGVPAISFTMADNQLISAKAFEEAGVIPCSGDIRHSKEQVMNSIMDFFFHMSGEDKPSSRQQTALMSSTSYCNRLQAKERMRCLIDGAGSARIARELAEL